MLTRVLREIFRTNLGVKKTERVLVFTDRPTKKDNLFEEDLQRWQSLKHITMLTVETGRAFAREILSYTYPSRGSHGVEPPEGLWRKAFGEKAVTELKNRGLLRRILQKKISEDQLLNVEKIIRRYQRHAVDAVVALSHYSTSHTRFRDLLTRICGCRYASMPLFDFDMLEGAMAVDWKALEKRTKAIRKILLKAVDVEIESPNGTRLTLSRGRRPVMADTGNLRRKGSFGNLPAGEVFFAPVEGSAEGVLVLEWAPTRRLKSPVTLIIKNGMVVDIEGEEEFASQLKDKIAERADNANIAELGIGTNDRAYRPDNILESEKILGTIHIALGDNSSFGGKVNTPFHQDFVFFNPTVKLILKDGSTFNLISEGRLGLDL